MSVDMLEIDVEKRLGGFKLGVKAELPLRGVTALFGPSGSGKTSLLRLIAGLERPDRGHIKLAGEVWASATSNSFMPAHRRGVAYVFQGGRLLDHLRVAGNLAYADKRASQGRYSYTFEDVVAAFDLQALMARKPATLSGGERQRVALAQALLSRPRLLLLDEPLSALDRQRKEEILPYLDRLQSRFNIPMLYVSHDLGEVTRLSDKVLMLENGQKIGLGDTVDTLNTHGFGGEYAGRSGVILTGQIGVIDTRLYLMEVQIAGNTLRLPYDGAYATGDHVRVILRAREIALSVKPSEGLSIQNSLQGTIKAIHNPLYKAMATVTVNIGPGLDMPVQLTRAAIEDLALIPDMPVFALVKTASLVR